MRPEVQRRRIQATMLGGATPLPIPSSPSRPSLLLSLTHFPSLSIFQPFLSLTLIPLPLITASGSVDWGAL